MRNVRGGDLQRVRSKDANDRLDALQTTDKKVRALVGRYLLGDSEAVVRCEAVRALAEISIRDHWHPIALHLHDPDWTVRSEAADALSVVGCPTQAMPALVAALYDNNQMVRRDAGLALRRFKKALPHLQTAIESDCSQFAKTGMRAAAIVLSDVEELPYLLGYLTDPDFLLRENVISVLDFVQDELPVPTIQEVRAALVAYLETEPLPLLVNQARSLLESLSGLTKEDDSALAQDH